MTRALTLGVWVLWAATACNVASVQEQPSAIPQNKCSNDSDCAFGTCNSKICRGSVGTFDTLLFEVTPQGDGTSINGVQFIKRVQNILKTEGSMLLPLDPLAQISGVITTPATCVPQFSDDTGMTLVTASDRSIPALVTVTPHTSALGLFSSPVAVSSVITHMATFSFNLTVPPGLYDIYIQPPTQPLTDCPIPPQLVRAQNIDGKNLSIALPDPSKFALHVTWPPGDGALDSWSVDMLEPISGHVISNRVQLVKGNNNTDYQANLAYLPVLGDDATVDQFVRLSPPAGLTAPTLLYARSGLGLFSATSGTLSQFTALPTPVHISGSVTRHVTPDPVAATVTLLATKLTGIDPGVVASFVRTIAVAQDGSFEAEVLPGSYHVSAVPVGVASFSQEPLGEANSVWEVGTSPAIQAGKVIELPDTLPINGQVLDPSGSIGMTGAQVQAVASPASIVTNVLHQALGEAADIPRAGSGTVDTGGGFKVKVDTGTYDFSVRPRSSSGFAWLVIPGLPVVAASGGAGLNTVNLPVPLAYHGTLTVPGATPDLPAVVPGAAIGAYIYMKAGAYTTDFANADSVLEIGETRSDEFGEFDLLIPAALNTVPQ